MKTGTRTVFGIIQILLPLLLVTSVLLPVFMENSGWPVKIRDYLEQSGHEETGAVNIVSSIYLGYRAYDTLGETIVLLVAISGTIGMIAYTGKNIDPEYCRDDAANRAAAAGKKPVFLTRKRTVLMEVVTGKLGPIVLIFGLYVILFGHMSPGGGFQGGVVIASGIIFITLGARGNYSNLLARADILNRIEALSFLLFVIASGAGIITGIGFFANPFRGTEIPQVGFIILLNAVIGLKVGSGLAYMSVAMMGDFEAC